MAIVLNCHLIEALWTRREAGGRAPYMVLDHNGQQHQTEVMKAGAVTTWNTKATFPYAPSSDLVIMAFDAAGRQPGACIAQAVVNVAAMLQGGSLNATAALVNRKGQGVGVVVFEVGLTTNSQAMAAGLNIPGLAFCRQHSTDSPRAAARSPRRDLSPTAAAAAGGRSSPFAQLEAQQGITLSQQQQQQQGSDVQPASPGTAQSMGQRLVGSISQALMGALLGVETRESSGQEGMLQRSRSRSVSGSVSSPRRTAAVSRSLDCSPTGQGMLRGAAAAAAAADTHKAGSNSSSPRNSKSGSQQRSRQAAQDTATRASSNAEASAPVMTASDRGSFSAWRRPGSSSSNGPLTASSPAALAAAVAVSSSGSQAAAGATAAAGGTAATAAALRTSSGSPSSIRRRFEALRPHRLLVPGPWGATSGDASSSNNASPASASNSPMSLSPLSDARSRLRLYRPPTLPRLSELFPQQQREGLIPVGVAPTSPGGMSTATGFSVATTAGFSVATGAGYNVATRAARYSQGASAVGFNQGHEAAAAGFNPRHEATAAGFSSAPAAGFSQGHDDVAASAAYEAVLREFEAADAAGKEEILYRELVMHQHEGRGGARQLLSALTQQQRQGVLEHRQLMDALEHTLSDSPITSPARAAAQAFRACLTSSSAGGSARSGSSPFRHYPNLPGFGLPSDAAVAESLQALHLAPSPAAAAAAVSAAAAAAPAAAAVAAGTPKRPAAGRLLQQLSEAQSEQDVPLLSARQGYTLLGDRVGDVGFASAQSSPTAVQQQAQQPQQDEAAAAAAAAVAEARQLNMQLLERLRQQELEEAAAVAAAAAATSVYSFRTSRAETNLSDCVSDAETEHDTAEHADSPLAASEPPASPAYTCKKAPGQLGFYRATSSCDTNTAAGAAGAATAAGAKAASKSRSRNSRWSVPQTLVVEKAVPYPAPAPTYPAIAVPLEPTAPPM